MRVYAASKPCSDGGTIWICEGAGRGSHLEWSLDGPGTLTPNGDHADFAGVGSAHYTGGTEGALVRVTVTAYPGTFHSWAAGDDDHDGIIEHPPPAGELPTPPTNLTVVLLDDTTARLEWDDPTPWRNEGYFINRSTTGLPGSYGRVGSVVGPTTQFDDGHLRPSTHYWYQVTSYNHYVNYYWLRESAPSNTVDITTPAGPPQPHIRSVWIADRLSGCYYDPGSGELTSPTYQFRAGWAVARVRDDSGTFHLLTFAYPDSPWMLTLPRGLSITGEVEVQYLLLVGTDRTLDTYDTWGRVPETSDLIVCVEGEGLTGYTSLVAVWSGLSSLSLIAASGWPATTDIRVYARWPSNGSAESRGVQVTTAGGTYSTLETGLANGYVTYAPRQFRSVGVTDVVVAEISNTATYNSGTGVLSDAGRFVVGSTYYVWDSGRQFYQVVAASTDQVTLPTGLTVPAQVRIDRSCTAAVPALLPKNRAVGSEPPVVYLIGSNLVSFFRSEAAGGRHPGYLLDLESPHDERWKTVALVPD